MTYLVDSHCHLHDREFFSSDQVEKMLENAKKNGVEKIVCIGTDSEDSKNARAFAESHEGVYWTFGIHPENNEKKPTLKSIFCEHPQLRRGRNDEPRNDGCEEWSQKILSEDSKLVAIGEVGLDYHSEGYDRDAQIKLFEQMLQLASDNNLPLSFHVRNAFDDFFPVVKNFPKVKGVVHSFTDSKKTLKKILETTDFYVGVNGLATYSTLPLPPLEKILLETDAPFLTPVPNRGKINEPAYIKDIAQWLSIKLGVESEKIAEKTTENVRNLFNI